jgi:ABC-2 type transport system permease protein
MPQSTEAAPPTVAAAAVPPTVAAGAPAEAAAAAVALPTLWWLAAARGGVEVKSFFRDKMAVAFIFGLPSILLVLLGSIFGGQAAARGVTVGQLFTAGMIAGGIMSTSFQYLAIGVATERESGMLKRLSGTPMPPAAYFAGNPPTPGSTAAPHWCWRYG